MEEESNKDECTVGSHAVPSGTEDVGEEGRRGFAVQQCRSGRLVRIFRKIPFRLT